MKMLIACLAAVATLTIAPLARAATTPGAVVIAGPSNSYPQAETLGQTITVSHGQDVEFVSLGIHSFTQFTTGTKLFDSGVVTGPKEVTSVANLAKGTYTFYCTVHGYALMHGTLVID
jgi:plastocyanin